MTKEKQEPKGIASATLAMLEMREVAKKYDVNGYFVVSRANEQKIHSGSFSEVLSIRPGDESSALAADLVAHYLHLARMLMEAMGKFWLINAELAGSRSRESMELVDKTVLEELSEMIEAIQGEGGMVTVMVHKSHDREGYSKDGKSLLDEMRKDGKTKELSEKSFPPALINRMRQIANAITGNYYEPTHKS